jgi:hypothetical protein
MEVNAWLQRSAGNSIRYRARQNPAKRALLLNSRPDGGTGRHENATTWAACGRDRRLPNGRTYPQVLDWISETGYLLRQTVSPVALAGEECFHFFRDLVHRLMIRLGRQANLLYADGFSIDPYRRRK